LYVLQVFLYNAVLSEIYTLSLHDALPILAESVGAGRFGSAGVGGDDLGGLVEGVEAVGVGGHEPDDALHTGEFHAGGDVDEDHRSEEHTSELQSREKVVCRLLLEKKKKHH